MIASILSLYPMQSRWNDAEAQSFAATGAPRELGLRVYTSRLLGSDATLVLHGGGNTSLKSEETGLLYVKGSGSDLAAVTAQDFAVVRLAQVRELINEVDLDNEALAAAVGRAVHRPGPKPSIETILHAVLPWPFVEHTHADSILAITNTGNGEARAREVFGELAPLVPFRHSGFALAQAAHEVYQRCATKETIGLVLLHHGVFAFGNTARESYENMLRLVTRAEDFLQLRRAWTLPEDARAFDAPDPLVIARLRARMSRLAGYPLLLRRLEGPQWQAYARRSDLARIAAEGPATPQHAVFIKREPLLGTDVDAYARRYESYVSAAKHGLSAAQCGLDPAPRAIVDPDAGVWAASVNEHYLGMTIDILRQDMEIKTRAAAHDRYAGLPAEAILEAEIHYGGFERRLHAAPSPTTNFLGEVVLLCGERSDWGPMRAGFEAEGAAVIELSPPTTSGSPQEALAQVALRHGGLDVVVAEGAAARWIEPLLPVLRCAPRNGRVLILADSTDEDHWPVVHACGEARIACSVISGPTPGTPIEVERAVAACRIPPAEERPALQHPPGAMV